MSRALNYKALLYATPTHLPSICPFTRPHVIISALSMHLPPVLWAWIRAPATHFLGARILTTLPLSIPPAAFSALPQTLAFPLLCNYTVLPVPLSTGPYLDDISDTGVLTRSEMSQRRLLETKLIRPLGTLLPQGMNREED